MTVTVAIADLGNAAGTALGCSRWLGVDQARIDGFARPYR